MRRPILLVLVALVLAVGSACTTSDDDGTSPTSDPPPGQVTTPAPRISASTTNSVNDDTALAALGTMAPDDDSSSQPATPTTTLPTNFDPATTLGGATTPAVGDRPYDLVVPTTYDPSVPMPLIVGLHGYTSSGAVQKLYFGLEPLAQERGFLLAHPDGTTDRAGQPFWNATNACCDLFRSTVDDSTFLTDLIDDVVAKYNVDLKRIYVTGLSNGGFMSHRMACDHADRVAAIVSMAGAVFADAALCTPSEPVNIVEIHGTSDETVLYEGDAFLGTAYPGAVTTVSTWAALNECESAEPTGAGDLDLVAEIDGNESKVESFSGCPPGGSVELWTMNGATHVPALSPTFATTVVDWLLAHPDP